MGPICIFPFGGRRASSLSLPFTDFTAFNNKWTNPMASSKFLWHQWCKSIIAGRGYTSATSLLSVDTPTIIFEHLRMAFIKFANQKNFVPSSKLDTAKVRQRRPSTKAPVLHFVRQCKTSALPLS
jgi:hypothetical protein